MSDDPTDDATDAGELNAQEREELTALTTELVRRRNIAAAMGQSFGNVDERDYFQTLGYPERAELGIDNYRAKFERGGIAETIVTAVSGQTWSAPPEVIDDGERDDPDDRSDFEEDVAALFDEKKMLNYLDRADTLQRIGRYGILLIGFDDGQDLDQPVDESKLKGDVVDDILYFQPFGEDNVDFDREEDPTDERFGLPKMYDVDFGDDGIGYKDVHHSRVVHLAEGALEDEAIGRSAYEAIFNYLVDLTKVVGGSSEMYWRDAKKRFVAGLKDDAGSLPDEDKVATQVEEMVNDLRDVVWARNLELDEVGGGSPDPSGLKDSLLELIAGVTRIPKRRLLGTERGDLASTQDEAAFVGMIEERRQKFAEPQLFRPLIDMLVDYGIISSPLDDTYEVDWPDLFELTEVERAEVMQRKAKAYKDASSMGDPAEIATTEERRDDILDLPPERGALVDPQPGPADPEDDPADDPTDVDDVDPEDPLDEDDPDVEEFFEDIFEGDGQQTAVPDGGEE